MFAKNIYTGGCCLDINPELLNIEVSDFLDNDLLFNQPFSGVLSTQLGTSLNNFSNAFSIFDFKKDAVNIIHDFKEDLLGFHREMNIIGNAVQCITKRVETQKLLISKLFKAREYIHRYYTHKITLKVLAEVSGISKFHFARVFKNCFKMTPLEMQEQLRMKKAKELILKDHISLTSIAYQLGYTDLALFSKRFKKYYKISPSRYIK
ncbi:MULTISPECIES: helix-turn-helix domain-containing protein [Aquimarina]|uniref:helix-turn-helix domain-containing protein n=1 Tax=Aquimarina TaxID=290174 RepID=UPI000D69847A|nr:MULTISPECIES: AraC family transcriptional regulator [Aquimarina]